MKSFRLILIFFADCLAKENKISYPWNTTWVNPGFGRFTFDLADKYANVIVGEGLVGYTVLLLKQGLKIGYLPPTEYNRKFKITKKSKM